MPHKILRKKWILYRHTNNFDLLINVAVNLKYFINSSISKTNKLILLKKLKELNYYKERNPKLPLDSINHRINTLAYFMFGYKEQINGENRFLFSPLGNLFLKHIGNKDSISKIFLTMLWAIQFEHPHGGTDNSFQLYPFRLIFKLLTDERIDYKLYIWEISYLIVFIEIINKNDYEKLVEEIIKMRTWSNQKIKQKFQKDEHVYVNSIYEWDYYISVLLQSANVLEKTNGEIIGNLVQGKNTVRKLTKNEIRLSKDLFTYCGKLLEEYSFLEKPLLLNDPERLRIDVIKEIYSFYPRVLLNEIGEAENDLKLGLLELPKLIEQYSNNKEGTEAYLFEDILVEGFNMFFNIEAKKIGGAGMTDIECLYITKHKKFAVDAKSTKNKLSALNAGRLAQHRMKIGGEYTIVVTPRYVPAVLCDIISSPIVIIMASTFSEYLYNHIDNNIREINYADFDDIIVHNLGKDISKYISDLTIKKFSIKN